MKATEEQEMHELAKRLVVLTEGTGWEMARYWLIGKIMDELAEYCCPSTMVKK